MNSSESSKRRFVVDVEEYPFDSRWFDCRGSDIHFVDEGEGMPVVMCHGNPTWSFLYRNIIKELAGECRCIAYDLPGFGFSEHPDAYSYTPQEHVEGIEDFLLNHLQLDKFILVMQDWGGPIGLDIASRHPDRVTGLVISSTFAWPPTTIGKVFSALLGSRLGQYLVLQRNFFAARLVPMLLGSEVPESVLQAYVAPFPTPDSRMGTAVFPEQISGASPWLAQLENRLHTLADVPVEFVFGLKDLGTRTADRSRWLQHFPDAGVQEVPTAGHYTQEDCPEAYVEAICRILSQIDTTNRE
ncbi:MAG: alpha/beta fold hydrolase [Halieaceae bacterium]|nr:alpha/beta fold hydrolase [Halieaceae bacterium]